MSELAAKLKKRRDVVDLDGLLFESTVKESTCTASARGENGSGCNTFRPTPRSPPQCGGRDFHDAIHRRREHVETGGETWESTPAKRIADCASDPFSVEPHSISREMSGDSISKDPVERPRIQTNFESKCQDCAPKACLLDQLEAAATERPGCLLPHEVKHAEEPERNSVIADTRTDCETDAAARAPAVRTIETVPECIPSHVERSMDQAQVVKEHHALVVADRGEESKVEAQCDDEPHARADSSESDEEDVFRTHTHHEFSEEGSENEGNSVPSKCPSPPRPFSQPKEVMVKGKRITWLVELQAPCGADGFESPPFSFQGCEGASLRLFVPGPEDSDRRCLLTLRGPADRPAGIQVMLFAGKGWKQKNFKSWQDGEDLAERFEVSMGVRTRMLCGLVHH